MPFLPNFNLTCNIWHQDADNPVGAPNVVSPCQLYIWKGPGFDVSPGRTDLWHFPVYLRLPAGTDIRFSIAGGPPLDTVEVPAGTGRFYLVAQVEDSHKGFANEYRVAVIIARGIWPVPYP